MGIEWKIRVHPLAVDELREMKHQRNDRFQEVEEVLDCLCDEPDPRHPTRDKRLNVVPMRWDAIGWYRVRTFRLNLRVVFRVLETRGSKVVEVGPDQRIHESAHDHCIQVMRAAERATVYNGDFRRRRKQVQRKETAA